MINKCKDKKYFTICDLKQHFNIKKNQLKIINSNLSQEQSDLILKNGYTIECNTASKSLIDLNLIKIVNV